MKNISIFKKILIVFTIVGLLSISITNLFTNSVFKTTLKENIDKQFTIDLNRKKYKLERFFENSEKKIEALSKFSTVKNLYKTLKHYHIIKKVTENDNYPVHTEEYTQLTKNYTNYFTEYIKQNNYYDFFIICAKHGHVMFTISHEDDFGTNLSYGKYKESSLAKLWKKVISEKRTVISDFQPYAPSNNSQAMFMGTPIFINKKVVAVLAIQISEESIDNIVNDQYKIYKTSEVYIVGKTNDNQYQLKTNRVVKKGKIGDNKKDNVILNCLNKQESGKTIKIGSTGNVEYDYHTPLNIKDLKWGMFNTVSLNEVLAPVKRTEKVVLVIAFLGILLIVIAAYWLSKSISLPIEKVVGYMKKIANKQLNFQIEENRKDEIGELYKSINKVNNSLHTIITNIKETSNVVYNAGNQLSGIAQQLAQGTNEQAATTEEISASMEQMLATIISNVENAEITEKKSNGSAIAIQENNKIFIETINAVSEISNKISIITEIAEKTDILSINAAIEAARSAESGRGFAVVAQEIRKLADKTKIASERITELSEKGKDISHLAGEKLAEIIPEITQSAKLVNGIALASKEQQGGIEMINSSILQLSEITNQNSASAEEMSTSTEELSVQAEQLKELIAQFKIN